MDAWRFFEFEFFFSQFEASTKIPSLKFLCESTYFLCQDPGLQTLRATKKYVTKLLDYVKFARGIEYEHIQHRLEKVVREEFKKR